MYSNVYYKFFPLVIAAILFLAGSSNAQQPSSSSAKYIQSQDTNIPGIVAELTECKRKDGVLTVKIRFRNIASSKVWLSIDSHHGNYDGFYIAAENKKFFILKDSDGAPLAPKYLGGVHLEKDQNYSWWAKFPAPSAKIKSVTLILPQVPPFEDVPVTDQ